MTEDELRKKKKKRHKKRIRKLIFTTVVSCLILISSTYAWFIGMQEVNVEPFEIEISSADSLLLSLNGNDWDKTISFSRADLEQKSYSITKTVDGEEVSEYSFNWPTYKGWGLVPLSSVGEMDSTVSRMKLFEKAGVSTTAGGLRLLSSRVNNYGAPMRPGEKAQDGYVAFDLFIKNFSGTNYIQELNILDEEPIYLTTNSSVGVGDNGVQGHGVENSVRVAFAQIGRVNGYNTNSETIQKISCDNGTDKNSIDYITGICRTAQIWEPNDIYHEDVAIKEYDRICRQRIGEDISLDESYDRSKRCNALENLKYSKTYSIFEKITSDMNIDVYDGDDYNGYTVVGDNGLREHDFFTDTEKNYTGTLRPEFMLLAANSITKVRIYIYIEGQDIDNFDFSSEGRQIKVNFGFSKQRLTTEDIEYTGPKLPEDVYPDRKDVVVGKSGVAC